MKNRSISLFQNMLRLLKYRLIIPLLRSEKPVQYKAKGVAVGLAWALTPLVGIQMWLVFVTWLIWKKISKEGFSLTLALAWTWVTNVFTLVPVYYIFYVTGQLLQGHFSDISGYDNLRSIIADTFFAEYGFWEKWGLFFKLLVKDWGFSMFVGCLPWIVIGYVSGYYFTMAFEKARAERKLKKALKTEVKGSKKLLEN